MSERYEPNLAQVRSMLVEIVRAWRRCDLQDGQQARERAVELVMELAEPLHQLSREPQFQQAFRARFREIFDGAEELSGMEELCQQLAPACTWCMLYVMTELGPKAGEM